MKRLSAALALALGVLALSGCSAISNAFHPPKEGYVIEKSYDDPDRWQERVSDTAYVCKPTTRTVYDSTSKSYRTVPDTSCGWEVVGYHYEQRYDGPHWTVKIRSQPDEKGKTRTGTWPVTEQEYSRLEIGSWFPLGSQPPAVPGQGGDF